MIKKIKMQTTTMKKMKKMYKMNTKWVISLVAYNFNQKQASMNIDRMMLMTGMKYKLFEFAIDFYVL